MDQEAEDWTNDEDWLNSYNYNIQMEPQTSIQVSEQGQLASIVRS